MPKKKNGDNGLFQLHPISMETVLEYQKHEEGEPFVIMIKVPFASERFIDDHKHFTKSNINVCYAAPRTAKKPRNWYETQLNVSTSVRGKDGYPYKGVPFFVVTDDGFGFMAHTTSENNKQFAAVGDELILGRWIKDRLVAEGLVEPVINTFEDKDRKGMITKEMLMAYGCNAIAFQKTDMMIADPLQPKNRYEVWTLKLIQISEEV